MNIEQERKKAIQALMHARERCESIEQAREDADYLQAAWQVVVVNEKLIHYVLARRKLEQYDDRYEDAFQWLAVTMFECCWSYDPTRCAPATYFFKSLSGQLNSFFQNERRLSGPYSLPIGLNSKQIKKRLSQIPERARIARENERGFNQLGAAEALARAQYAFDAKQLTSWRLNFGEAGEPEQIETDPVEAAINRNVMPFDDPVCDDATAGIEYAEVRKLMDTVLTERQRDIVSLRLGLDAEEKMTLQEIADLYHLSRERIRQIEREAYSKLRKCLAPQFKTLNDLPTLWREELTIL